MDTGPTDKSSLNQKSFSQDDPVTLKPPLDNPSPPQESGIDKTDLDPPVSETQIPDTPAAPLPPTEPVVDEVEPSTIPASPPEETKKKLPKLLLVLGSIFLLSLAASSLFLFKEIDLSFLGQKTEQEEKQTPQQLPQKSLEYPAFQCLALESDLTPEPGSSLSLTCSGSGIASENPADYQAEFKLSYSPDTTSPYSLLENLGQVDLDNNAHAQASYLVPSDLEAGYYYIECRICHKTEGNCTQWGQAY